MDDKQTKGYNEEISKPSNREISHEGQSDKEIDIWENEKKNVDRNREFMYWSYKIGLTH